MNVFIILEILHKKCQIEQDLPSFPSYFLLGVCSSSVKTRKKKTPLWNFRFPILTFVLWNTSEGFDIPTSRKNSSGWKLPCCPAKDCFWKCWWKMNQMRCCVWLVCLINTGTKPFAVQAGVWYGSTASVLSLYPDSRRQKTQRRGLAGILP